MRKLALAGFVLGSFLTGAAPAAASEGGIREKFDLWRTATGPHLRGAAIAQRLRYPEIDGDFIGTGPLGGPYQRSDFDKLAARGANVVLLSHAGPFDEAPPYRVNKDVVANLDRLIGYAKQADLFVVISYRTGPGRSAFTFHAYEGDTWFPKKMFNDRVWVDKAAQQAWAAMWRWTAERYRDNPVVVGYELMTEPNSHLVGGGMDDRIEIFDPARFHRKYGGTSYDWNELYPVIVQAVRSVDPKTPILISGNGYASTPFLPYVKPVPDSRVVYTVHQYAPEPYTHQEKPGKLAYPGPIPLYDGGRPEPVGRPFLERLFGVVDAYKTRHRVEVAVTEFGVARWAPGAARFLEDQIELMEKRGMASILWHWPTSYEVYERKLNTHNYFYGSDPASTAEVPDSDLARVILKYWARNQARPSLVRFVD